MTSKKSRPEDDQPLAEKVKITMPVTEKDFIEIEKLIDNNVVYDSGLRREYYKNLSVSEILIAKDLGKVMAVVVHKKPGSIFEEISDDHFDLPKYKVGKEDIGYIYIIAVDPEYRRRGIGQLLVSEALKYQKEYGSKVVAVHCMQSFPGNASEKLFTKMGFKPVKMHQKPWYEHSKKVGSADYACANCGNPCKCDDLEMMSTF